MELRLIRGGNVHELEARSYNIGVGISLGNKWFTTQNIVDLVKWSLQYTREIVVVYVADSIHAINLEVRNRISSGRAMTRSTRMGSEIIQSVREQIEKSISQDDLKKIVYVTWNEIIDAKYERKMAFLIRLFFSSENFRNKVTSIVRDGVAKEARKFTDDEIQKLSMYILHEMPELICRVPMKEYRCDAYVYPFDGELTRLAEQIQKGEVFPEIKENILDTEPKVFLEVR